MKLNDDTTIKTLREFIGQKIMTRTSRSPIKVTGVEITDNEAWFIGLEGSRKRKIKPQYVSEIWAEDEPKSEQKKRSKTPQELKEERLKKAEEAEAKKKLAVERRDRFSSVHEAQRPLDDFNVESR